MSAQVKRIVHASYNAEERREIAAFFRQLIAGGVKTARIAHEAGISEGHFYKLRLIADAS